MVDGEAPGLVLLLDDAAYPPRHLGEDELDWEWVSRRYRRCETQWLVLTSTNIEYLTACKCRPATAAEEAACRLSSG